MGSRAQSRMRWSLHPIHVGGAVIVALLAFCGYSIAASGLAEVRDPLTHTRIVNDTANVLDWDCTTGPISGVKPGDAATLMVDSDPTATIACTAREVGERFCPSVPGLQRATSLTATALLDQHDC
ncbi:hypothetical protein GCM10025867_51480 (plasmid) [Frondihabitans sucicola]|uniref:Uncharacterized protein n=1 Tax=Frondihabitans sucicola TaxID=1268041 RepID=A0ABM8GWM9_9MICO|nr:hypothetical protein [Frondihabitans sucicola]BDZ52340.1 hypothetical protein GCM10025867_45810 [Frondihabitans sucicola]BDZ52907.1 hypothetical protein GCM10025867_51480 [Frondihabitans sucicola]